MFVNAKVKRKIMLNYWSIHACKKEQVPWKYNKDTLFHSSFPENSHQV